MNTTGNLLQVTTPTEEVIRLDHDFFPHPWSREQWQVIDAEQNILLEWKGNEGHLGFALFGYSPGDDVAHLYKILLHPSYQGSGQADAFWSAIVDLLREKGFGRIYLEVEAENARAISFYRKKQFQLLRRNKGYYSNGQDALIMELVLRVAAV